MSDPIVSCPKCGHKFTITKALTAQIEKRLRGTLDAEIEAHDAAKDAAYDAKLAKELKKLQASAKKTAAEEAREEISGELDELRREIRKKDSKLKQVEQREQAVLAKESALDVTVKREVEKAQRTTREAVARTVGQEYLKKELGFRKTESDLRKKLQEATWKLEQGSQQKQGELMEQELEKILGSAFSTDKIEPVPQGKPGADILQRVMTSSGDDCGTIIWESKDTKTWNAEWLPKLKQDQRREKAQLAVLVTSAFPKTLESHFGQVSGVWIIEKNLSIGLATALRINLLELARVQQADRNKPEKMEVLYQYLMSTQFRQRVESILESFVTMNEDLNLERRTVERQWAKREKQIQMVVQNMSGMVGDIRGIDPSFPQMKRLELPSS
jgi:hypothetical protein